MRTKILSVLLVFLISALNIKGQDVNYFQKKPSYKNAMGIGLGFTTGYGLAYRYTVNKFGVQVNFAPYINDYGKNASISVGLTLLNRIVEGNSSNLYLYFANDYLYRKRKNYNGYGLNYDESEKWNTGIGLGFEFNTKKRVVLNVMGGYAQYNSFQMLFFTGELALFYRFN